MSAAESQKAESAEPDVPAPDDNEYVDIEQLARAVRCVAGTTRSSHAATAAKPDRPQTF
jgi:hypothetical protein